VSLSEPVGLAGLGVRFIVPESIRSENQTSPAKEELRAQPRPKARRQRTQSGSLILIERRRTASQADSTLDCQSCRASRKGSATPSRPYVFG